MVKVYFHYLSTCLALFTLCLTGYVDQAVEATPEQSFELRAGVFIPAAHKFKHIYGNNNWALELQYNKRLPACFEAWANFDWFSRHVHRGDPLDSQLKIATLSAGVQYVHEFNPCLDCYLGLGPCLTRLQIDNKYCCGEREVTKTVIGAVSKAGIRFYPQCNILADLFCDYYYQPMHFENRVNVGGFKAGLGLGVAF